MYFKKITMTICSLVLAFNLFACANPVDIDNKDDTNIGVQNFPVTVSGLTISSQPKAVAVISPSAADMVLALGYEDSLALATADCTQTELESLEKVDNENYQEFVNAGVDLVVTDEIDPVTKDFFDEHKISVFVIENAKNRSEFEKMYSQLGSVLRGATTGYENGIDQAKSIYTTLDDISRVIPYTGYITTAAVILDMNSKAVTGDMIGDDVISSAGATNVFTGLTGGNYDFEQLSIANPDYIFCAYGMSDDILNSADYQNLKAVQNGNVYEIEQSGVLCLGRSLINGATTMAGYMYPALLGEQEEPVAD